MKSGEVAVAKIIFATCNAAYQARLAVNEDGSDIADSEFETNMFSGDI